MKTKFLLPNKFKIWGWFLLIPSAIIGIYTVTQEWEPDLFDSPVISLNFGPEYFQISENNILNEILGIIFIIAGLTVAFSKEKDEDEFTMKMRLESLVWALYWNYGILIFAFLFVYEFEFYWVMIFNMFTPLVFFLLRFNWLLWKSRRSLAHEE